MILLLAFVLPGIFKWNESSQNLNQSSNVGLIFKIWELDMVRPMFLPLVSLDRLDLSGKYEMNMEKLLP